MLIELICRYIKYIYIMLYADRTVTSFLHFSITPNAAFSNHRSLRRVVSRSIEGQPRAHIAKRKASNIYHDLVA